MRIFLCGAALMGVVLAAASVLRANGTVHLPDIGAVLPSLKQEAGRHPLSSALYFAGVFVAMEAIGLPCAALFSLLAGMLFPLGEAFCLAWAARGIGDVLFFLSARGWLKERLLRRHGHRLARLERRLHGESAALLVMLRLVPGIPSVAATLAMALLSIGVRRFAVWNTLGIAFWTGGLAWAGHAAGSFETDSIDRSWSLAAAAIAAAIFASRLMAKRKKAKAPISDARSDGRDPPDPNG